MTWTDKEERGGARLLYYSEYYSKRSTFTKPARAGGLKKEKYSLKYLTRKVTTPNDVQAHFQVDAKPIFTMFLVFKKTIHSKIHPRGWGKRNEKGYEKKIFR